MNFTIHLIIHGKVKYWKSLSQRFCQCYSKNKEKIIYENISPHQTNTTCEKNTDLEKKINLPGKLKMKDIKQITVCPTPQ